jgi:hypothetical protein
MEARPGYVKRPVLFERHKWFYLSFTLAPPRHWRDIRKRGDKQCSRKLRLWFHMRQRWDARKRNHLRRNFGVAPGQTGWAKLVWSHRLSVR